MFPWNRDQQVISNFSSLTAWHFNIQNHFLYILIHIGCAEDDEEAICHRMVLVCGTSNCHMAMSKTKLFIPGVWGPFWSGMF